MKVTQKNLQAKLQASTQKTSCCILQGRPSRNPNSGHHKNLSFLLFFCINLVTTSGAVTLMVRQVEKFGRICQNLLEPGHGGAQLHRDVMFRLVDQIFVVTPERRLRSKPCHRERCSRAFRQTSARVEIDFNFFLADESEKFREGRKKKRKVNFLLSVEEKSHRMRRFVNIFAAGMCSRDWEGLRGRMKVKVVRHWSKVTKKMFKRNLFLIFR